MRLDRDDAAFVADMFGQRHRIGTDICADIHEGAAARRMLAQKIQLGQIVIGIEQRTALGAAGQMMQPERCALILRVDGTGSKKVHDA